MRVWGLENPHATVEEQKSKEKVMVWCAMTSTSILGPHFFEDTVTGESYLDMLKRDGSTFHTIKGRGILIKLCSNRMAPLFMLLVK